MSETIPPQQRESSEPQQVPWTAERIAAVVLLAIFCAILVWKAYTPDDIFLSDLVYEVFISDVDDPVNDKALDGSPLTIGENGANVYPKGISVHANTSIQYRFIPNGYHFFVTEVGVDGSLPLDSPASVRFTIFGDGTVLYESPIMKAGMPPRQARVSLKGRRELTLVVTDAGDGNVDDKAHWALARFTYR